MTEHLLVELRRGSPLVSGSNHWRGWACSCGAAASGYHFPSDVAAVNAWAEHLLAATRESA